MKKLRTIITMLLVLTMALSSIGVFAEEASVTSAAATNAKFSDILAGSKVEEAVTKLVAHSIISGYPDGTFKPDGEITRAEFAAVITRFKGIGDNLAADAVTGFADLDNDTQNAWARPYVKAAVDAKIINGFEDGTFRASQPVTYEQAVKMIICALGYEVVAQSELSKLQAINSAGITWSSGYIAAANKNGITVGAMTANISAPATRGTVAILTSNAVDAPPLRVNDDGSYEKEDPADTDKKLVEIEGTVTGTYYTGLDRDNVNVALNQLMITTSENGEETYELSPSLASSIDLEDIVGKRVVAYYDTQDRIITTISQRNNTVFTVDEKDVIRPISPTNFRYTNENGRTENLDLTDYVIIYNGKFVSSVPNINNDFRNGTIEFIESSNYKVAKITSYKVFVVNSFDKTNEKIYFKYQTKYDNNDGNGLQNYYLFPSATSRKPEIYVNGSLKEFSSLSLAAYNVINYMESPASASGNPIKKMYVTTGSKSGTVTASLGEERLVELGNAEYYLTNDYVDYTPTGTEEAKAPFELDDNYTYYVDCTGQIAAIKYSASSTGSYKYGYITGEGKEDNQYKIKLITQDGTEKIYPLKSSVKVDGAKVSDENVSGKLKITAALANSAYNSAVLSWNAEAVLSGDYCYQPVRYSLSGSSIEAIDTVYDNPEDDSNNDTFICDLSLSGGKVSTSTAKVGSFGVSGSSIVLYVPDTRTDSKAYAKMAASNAFAVTSERWVEVYDADQSSATKNAKFVIVYEKDPTLNFLPSSPFMLVTGKKVQGENVILTGYKNASTETTEVTVSTKYRSTFDVAESEYYIKSVFDATYCSNPEDINVGDFIRYITDANSEIIAIQRWYDAENPTQAETATSFDNAKAKRYYFDKTGGGADFYVRYGEPIELNIEDKTLTHTMVGKNEISGYDHLSTSLTYSCSNSKVYIYDGSTVTYVETLDSIYDHNTENPSKVMVVSSTDSANSGARLIYIINE